MHQTLQLIAIAGVLLLSVVSPGPNFAVVTSTAAGMSRRAGLLAGLGLAAASLTWTILVIAGVGVILAKLPLIYTAVRVVGAVYLIWIGVRMLLGARNPAPAAGGAVLPGFAAFRKAYLVSMTSPKSIAFYGSIFTVMVPTDAPGWFYVAIAAIAFVISASWYCGLALLFSHPVARRFVARAKAAIDATMGLVLIGFGGKLLLAR